MAKLKRKRRKSPLEFKEQLHLARFLDRWKGTAGYWWHTPNGGWRGTKTGQWLYKMGAKAGVPDIIIIKPCIYRGEYYTGCAIELKRTDAPEKAVTPTQRRWLGRLSHAGWLATWTRGATEAIDLIRVVYPEHLPIPPPRSRVGVRREVARRLLRDPDTRTLSDRRIAGISGFNPASVGVLRAQTPCKHAEEGLSVSALDELLSKIVGRHEGAMWRPEKTPKK